MINNHLKDFFEYLLYERRLSQKTYIAYQTDLNQFEKFLSDQFPKKSLENVTYQSIRKWIVALVDAKVKPRSINRKIIALKQYYKYLEKCKGVETNPVDQIDQLKSPKRISIFANLTEMEKLLQDSDWGKSFNAIRAKTILEVFYATGIRLQELINLKKKDVDYIAYTLKILGKNNKERIVPFPKILAGILKNYLSKRDQYTTEHDYLFITNIGKPCYPMFIQRIVKSYLQQYTHLEKQSPHILRHTYATHLLNQGAELNDIKTLLGHANLTSTQIYTHNQLERIKKVYDQCHPKA